LPIGTGTITTGPPEYSPTYDVDVSAFIQNQANKTRDKLIIGNLPPGDYFIILTDTCGVVYPGKPFTIKPYNGDSASYLARPDCEVGYGSIQLSGATFQYVEMTAAPAAFSADHPLPYEVTQHVHPIDGGLYMDHLPPGQYKFKAHNDCDDDILMGFTFAVVPAYNITADEYVLTPHCGSFDLFLNHQSTGMAFVGFYLQKWDEALGKWTHPGTGFVYDEGTEILAGPSTPLAERNALKLNNNATNYSLLYPTGKYRVVKQYVSFGDGEKSERIKYCTPTLYEFEYYSDLFVSGAVSLSCTGNSGDVMIDAVGVPPLSYTIISHDGSPYFFDNGTSNIFSGLTSGLYTIEVSDPCGHTQPLTFNVADIPALVYVTDPQDLDSIEVCDEGGDNKETFDISGYTPIILDGQDPQDVTITYHTLLTDAEQGINALPNPASVLSGTATIYARATHELNADCAAITWFDLIVNPMPQLSMKDKWGGCEGKDVIITADSGFSYYEWTNAAGTITIIGPDHITVSDEGSYTVTVRDNIGCEGSKTVEVVKSPIPVINTVTIKDWTDKDNVLTVLMEPTVIPSHYEYSLDNIHYQDSPVFDGLIPGQYTVYVRDEFGCGQDEFETYILTYPKFFTPNGDGINEYWRIYLSALEPDMLVYIYDRYGKLITGFDVKSKGWDGTLNGSKLPATDYWFVVKRQNGQELKGHFSMIR
jgi:gliding motility-associated-like protein